MSLYPSLKTQNRQGQKILPANFHSRVGKKNKAVLISEEDYNSIQETLYLLKSPKNAILLYKAMEEVKQKKFIKKDLKDLMNE